MLLHATSFMQPKTVEDTNGNYFFFQVAGFGDIEALTVPAIDSRQARRATCWEPESKPVPLVSISPQP